MYMHTSSGQRLSFQKSLKELEAFEWIGEKNDEKQKDQVYLQLGKKIPSMIMHCDTISGKVGKPPKPFKEMKQGWFSLHLMLYFIFE